MAGAGWDERCWCFGIDPDFHQDDSFVVQEDVQLHLTRTGDRIEFSRLCYISA
jgi:hypothetical protein